MWVFVNLLRLGQWEHQGRRVKIGTRALADECGKSRSAVVDALAQLEAAGLLKSIPGNREEANCYELFFPDRPEGWTENQSRGGPDSDPGGGPKIGPGGGPDSGPNLKNDSEEEEQESLPDGRESSAAPPGFGFLESPEGQVKRRAGGAAATEQAQLVGLLDAFNEICRDLPEVRELRGKRLVALRKFWREAIEQDPARWTAYCKRVAASRFLNGQNDKHWKAGIDWMLKVENHDKVMEGQFDR